MNETIRELFDISHQINYEYANLKYYSSMDMDESNFFQQSIANIRHLILLEDEIVSKLETEELRELLDNLPEIDSEDFDRTYNILLDKYRDKLCDDGDLDLVSGEISFYYELESLPIDCELEELVMDDYRYHDLALAYVYILAIKKEIQLLKEIIPHNEMEKTLKNIYYKNFKSVKYDIFQDFSPYFEKIAATVSFNPLEIPDMKMLDIDVSNMYYNECYVIIKRILELVMMNDIDEFAIMLLFYVLCFEELINYLNKEQLMKINKFMNGIKQSFGESLPINACLNRIRKKTN